MPRIPPRPLKGRPDRSISPNPDRFAPSPLNEGILSKGSARSSRLSAGGYDRSRPERPGSVEIPEHAGEEGREYDSLAAQLGSNSDDLSSSPEQTRTVGADIKLHAPKPSLPAQSAKQRVAQVTRTDSDRAASFGIGRPGSAAITDTQPASSNRSLKKKASTTSQLSTSETHFDDEQGIPEIGQQVPMFPNAGDVQAPSPAPGALGEGLAAKNHKRRTSSRGNLPPGSYGLHGHGVAPMDKLERAYFEKHPDLLKKEHTLHHHDRPGDFSMSSEDLNKIVRETASRGSGLGVGPYTGTPTEQVGWQAIEESVSRPASTHPQSPVKKYASISTQSDQRGPEEGEVIHVDDPNSRRRSVMFSDDETPTEDEPMYSAPILAEDEILKGPTEDYGPVVEPRRHSGFDEESLQRPSSRSSFHRSSSRPSSLYRVESHDHQPTPLEDVEEYEPLFPEDDKAKDTASEAKPADTDKLRPNHIRSQRFPSRDIWEDAPDSVHYTVEVSTPEVPETRDEEGSKPETDAKPKVIPREGETFAQAFARLQEELAERETRKHGADTFLKNSQKPSWVEHQPHLAAEKSARPSASPRFPSRDVWEDTPDSHMLETTVSTPQQDELESPIEAPSKPEIPDRRPASKQTEPSPADKPAIPERPKKSASGDDSTSKPSIPERPKPSVPARPVKAGPTSGGQDSAEAAAPPRQKPAVPARPLGGKIAALQGNFLQDLNKKLGLGPQAPKKEEPAAEEEKPAEEKAPLVDARKTRARGPQRRAPAAASKSPSSAGDSKPSFSLGFVVPATVFEIDPEEEEVEVKVTGAPLVEVKENTTKQGEKESSAVPSELPEAKHAADQPEKVESVSEVKKPITETESQQETEQKTEESTSVLDSVKDSIGSLVGKATGGEKSDEKEEEAEEAPKEESKEETKSLVTNEAGETVLATHVKEDKDGKVEPVGVEQ